MRKLIVVDFYAVTPAWLARLVHPGIATILDGGTLEHAQQIAAHASPKTTKLYDRTADTISLDEIERIVI